MCVYVCVFYKALNSNSLTDNASVTAFTQTQTTCSNCLRYGCVRRLQAAARAIPCAVFVAVTRDVSVQQLQDTWDERFLLKDDPWGRG